MEVNKILIPMDFSDCAVNAFRFAKKLARKSNAELILMNIANQPLVHVEAMGIGGIIEPIIVDYKEQTQEKFEKLFKKEKLDDITVSTRTYMAGFIDAINLCLSEENIDLIITGTNIEHDFLDSIFGSRSSDIITTSKVPVLMIPEKAIIDKVKKIGVAINFEEHNDFTKLDATRFFAEILDAQIIVLNITNESKKLFHHDDEKTALANYYGDIDPLFFTLSNKGDLVEILKTTCKELKLDILFMHPKKHRGLVGIFHKSITKSMAMQVDIPLLTVHE